MQQFDYNKIIAETLEKIANKLDRLAGDAAFDFKAEVAQLPQDLHDKVVDVVISEHSLEEVLQFHEKVIAPKLEAEKHRRELERYR